MVQITLHLLLGMALISMGQAKKAFHRGARVRSRSGLNVFPWETDEDTYITQIPDKETEVDLQNLNDSYGDNYFYEIPNREELSFLIRIPEGESALIEGWVTGGPQLKWRLEDVDTFPKTYESVESPDNGGYTGYNKHSNKCLKIKGSVLILGDSTNHGEETSLKICADACSKAYDCDAFGMMNDDFGDLEGCEKYKTDGWETEDQEEDNSIEADSRTQNKGNKCVAYTRDVREVKEIWPDTGTELSHIKTGITNYGGSGDRKFRIIVDNSHSFFTSKKTKVKISTPCPNGLDKTDEFKLPVAKQREREAKFKETAKALSYMVDELESKGIHTPLLEHAKYLMEKLGGDGVVYRCTLLTLTYEELLNPTNGFYSIMNAFSIVEKYYNIVTKRHYYYDLYDTYELSADQRATRGALHAGVDTSDMDSEDYFRDMEILDERSQAATEEYKQNNKKAGDYQQAIMKTATLSGFIFSDTIARFIQERNFIERTDSEVGNKARLKELMEEGNSNAFFLYEAVKKKLLPQNMQD